MFTATRLVISAVLALAIAATVTAAPRDALQQHMAKMLTDGDEWRTPNPDYQEGSDKPAEFGLSMKLSEDRSYVSGTLHGVFPDGRTRPYWTMLALYNPVTEKVVMQQIGRDGSLIHGEVPVQPGDEQTVDMILYGARGNMEMTRHVQRYDGPQHESLVYAYDDNGDWQLKQTWLWKRHALDVDESPLISRPPREDDDPLLRDAGYLLTGSGRWRADNPDYVEDGEMPRQFGMNYRWGRHGRHIVGEIVSHYADGRHERDWTLFITHNPITGRSHMEQTGGNGVYFRGELSRTVDGRHAQAGLIYLPNGRVKSVRDEVEMSNANTRIAHVYERDESGAWQKVRVWTWHQVSDAQ